MKKFLLYFIFTIVIFSSQAMVKQKPLYSAAVLPVHMSTKTKKHRFFYLVVPEVVKAYRKMTAQYVDIKKALKEGTQQKRIKKLKHTYRVTTDEELLLALKPHPKSIVLAQAAIESNWGTSRFFREANNIFGMWSSNDKEPRIAAGIKRGGVQTIWLKKFASLEESVEHYYLTIGRGKHYKEFREVRSKTDNPFEILKKLDMYSEMGEEYTKSLARMIRYNKLLIYDK